MISCLLTVNHLETVSASKKRRHAPGHPKESVCVRAIRLPEVEGLPRRPNFAHAEEGEPGLAGGQAIAFIGDDANDDDDDDGCGDDGGH